MFKYYKGAEWTVQPHQDEADTCEINAGPFFIASVYGGMPVCDKGEEHARLMRAAPEMYELLRTREAALDNVEPELWTEEYSDEYRMLRELLAKIEGEVTQ